MSVDGMTINLTASGNISPYRVVKVSGIRTGAAATDGADVCVGVTDGSPNVYNGTYNAPTGSVINLQQGPYVQIEAGASFSAGAKLMPSTGGKVITATGAGKMSNFVALEDAEGDGTVVWCFRGVGPTFLT